MDEPELVVLTTYTKPSDAEVLRIALEGAGIRCFLEDELQAALPGTVPIRVLVPKEELEKAQDILAAEAPLEEDEDDLPGPTEEDLAEE